MSRTYSNAPRELFPEPLSPQHILAIVHALQAGMPELHPGGHFPSEWWLDKDTSTLLHAWCEKYERLCEEALGLEPRSTPVTEEELRAEGWFEDALFPD